MQFVYIHKTHVCNIEHMTACVNVMSALFLILNCTYTVQHFSFWILSLGRFHFTTDFQLLAYNLLTTAKIELCWETFKCLVWPKQLFSVCWYWQTGGMEQYLLFEWSVTHSVYFGFGGKERTTSKQWFWMRGMREEKMFIWHLQLLRNT